MFYDELIALIKEYQKSFSDKENKKKYEEPDPLMEIFGITPRLVEENKQYWNRQLGYLFELICNIIFSRCKDYKPKEKIGNDAPFDFILGKYAIDTKYRIGSGDAGTLKKFKLYAHKLKEMGYIPVILLFREDNLPAAITACKKGGWKLYIGEECNDFILKKTKYNLFEFLKKNKNNFLLFNHR